MSKIALWNKSIKIYVYQLGLKRRTISPVSTLDQLITMLNLQMCMQFQNFFQEHGHTMPCWRINTAHWAHGATEASLRAGGLVFESPGSSHIRCFGDGSFEEHSLLFLQLGLHRWCCILFHLAWFCSSAFMKSYKKKRNAKTENLGELPIAQKRSAK